MTSWWNIGIYTYHVDIDIKKDNVKIHRENSDAKKDGKTYTFPLKKYNECTDGYAVEALYKSKMK